MVEKLAHAWIASSVDNPVPHFAVRGGYKSDSTPIYVGRCKHEGNMALAKVIPILGCTFVCRGGKEHVKYEYELLIGPGYGWVTDHSGSVPINAVSIGNTANGERLYVGRALYRDSLEVGEIQPSRRCLQISSDYEQIKLRCYEVLVCKYTDTWLPTSLDVIPPRAIVAGEDSDGTEIYVARAMYNGIMVPAKFVPQRKEAYSSSDACEINKTDVEVLVGLNYKWVKPPYKDVPPNAVYTDHSPDGRPLFIGRGHHKGSLCPGLVSLEENCLLIPYGGSEVRVSHYDVLTKPQ